MTTTTTRRNVDETTSTRITDANREKIARIDAAYMAGIDAARAAYTAEDNAAEDNNGAPIIDPTATDGEIEWAARRGIVIVRS